MIGVATQAGWSEKCSEEVTLAWKGVSKMSRVVTQGTASVKASGVRSDCLKNKKETGVSRLRWASGGGGGGG